MHFADGFSHPARTLYWKHYLDVIIRKSPYPVLVGANLLHLESFWTFALCDLTRHLEKNKTTTPPPKKKVFSARLLQTDARLSIRPSPHVTSSSILSASVSGL